MDDERGTVSSHSLHLAPAGHHLLLSIISDTQALFLPFFPWLFISFYFFFLNLKLYILNRSLLLHMRLKLCQFIQCGSHEGILILIYQSACHWPSQSVEADKLAAASMINMQENLRCVAKETVLWLYTVHDQQIRCHNHQLSVCDDLLSLLRPHHCLPVPGLSSFRINYVDMLLTFFCCFVLSKISVFLLFRIVTGRSFMSSPCFHTHPAAFTWDMFAFTPSVIP